MGTLEAYLPAFRKQLEMFIVFNEEEWKLFKCHLQLVTLEKKAYFVEAGDVCQRVGLIVKGAVRLFQVKDGAEITNYFCLDNEFVSSYKSFLKQEPSQTYVQAMESTLLVTFTHQGVQQLLANPVTAYKMERFGRMIAEYLICCYEDRVLSFVTQTPEERYAQLLNCNSEIFRRIPQHYLANYLGVTPVSLSRIRKRMFEHAR
jgi:CRP-like cAMP-binding protein